MFIYKLLFDLYDVFFFVMRLVLVYRLRLVVGAQSVGSNTGYDVDLLDPVMACCHGLQGTLSFSNRLPVFGLMKTYPLASPVLCHCLRKASKGRLLSSMSRQLWVLVLLSLPATDALFTRTHCLWKSMSCQVRAMSSLVRIPLKKASSK